MASLKEIKSRIGSIKSTRKITSAMRMVASAKLHKAQAAIENMLPYQQKMNSILTNFLSTAEGSLDSPYTIQRELQRVAIVVFSSNNSLCGAFNANVIRMFVNVVDTYKTLGYENIIVYPIGKKIEEAVRKMGYHCQGSFQQLADKPSYDTISEIADELMQLFINEEVDKIDIIFHHFRSTGVQELIHDQFLPIDLTVIKKDAEANDTDKPVRNLEYIVEPSPEEFIASLLPTVLKLKLYTALLDSNASEHAARTMAMQIATDNANELIQDLTVQYNKSRQQAITNELLDIIGGSIT